MQIKRLLAKEINKTYIDTLNDSYYMRFSRNQSFEHSIESQISYVNSFDTDLLKPNSLLFGVFKRNKLVGTLTVRFNSARKSANIGILVFPSYSSSGIGRLALTQLVSWIGARFPMLAIELGTNKSNIAMIKLARSCGFVPRINGDSEIVSFNLAKQNSKELDEVLNITQGHSLFFGTDTGGVEALLEFYLRTKLGNSLSVEGMGLSVLKYYGLTNTIEDVHDLASFTSLVFSTGINISRSQALQKAFHSAKKTTICILDHWVNYHRRFNFPTGCLPETLVTTNDIAYSIARDIFPNRKILLTPDYRLERLNHLSKIDFKREDKALLLVLEPERPELEGLDKISKTDILNSIARAHSLAKELGLSSVRVRLHPVMQSTQEMLSKLSQDESISLSTNLRVEDDLPTSKAVVGFSSSVLYSSAKLGIPTYSFLQHSNNSWLGRCEEIIKLNKSQI